MSTPIFLTILLTWFILTFPTCIYAYSQQKVKTKHGIILNPFKLAFLVHHEEWENIDHTFGLGFAIVHGFSFWIYQFIIPKSNPINKGEYYRNKYLNE